MSRYGLNQTVAPTTRPVTLPEMKLHLGIDHSEEDARLRQMIDAATMYWERVHGRQFINATYAQTWRNFRIAIDDDNIIRLARRPLVSITSIQYVDTAGSTQTWGASLYDFRTATYFGEIEPAYQQSYPSDVRSASESVTATYVAGYGAAETDVPEHYREGLKLWVEMIYEKEPKCRETLLMAAESLLNMDVGMVV